MSGKEIKAKLKRLLREAAKKGKSGKVILELFAGKGRIAAAVRRAGKHGALALDIALGVWGDLKNKFVLQVLRGWITSGRIAGVWLAFPCTTFSLARHPALRSSAEPRGMKCWRTFVREQALIEQGNRTMDAAVDLANCCLHSGVPAALENPIGSYAWKCHGLQKLCRHRCVRSCRVDFCRFGCRWRKRMLIVAVHG